MRESDADGDRDRDGVKQDIRHILATRQVSVTEEQNDDKMTAFNQISASQLKYSVTRS